MLKISDAIQWRPETELNGEIEYIGYVRVYGRTTISRYAASDSVLVDRAKRRVMDAIYSEIYGDIERKLSDIERSILASTSTDPTRDGGPMALVRELQASLRARK
jgi:hypothetical protein